VAFIKNKDMSDYLENDIEQIAVIGMAVRFPGADTAEQFWQNLKNGKHSITSFSDEELQNRGVKEEEGGYDVDAISYFFTDWEFDKIEQMGHSVYKDIFMRELGASSLGASITSLGEGLKQFIRAVLKG